MNLKKEQKHFLYELLSYQKHCRKTIIGWSIGKQIIRSGISVAANYRAACRSRSRAEFGSKIGIVIEEADETAFWLEIIIESKILEENLIIPLLKEVNEILAIMCFSRKTINKNKS